MKSKKTLMLIAAVSVIGLTACGQISQPAAPETTQQQEAEAILGAWIVTQYSLWLESPDDAVTLEGEELEKSFGNVYYKFNSDGTGTITDDSITQGKWQKTAPNTYLFIYTNGSTNKEEELMLVVDGDTMTGKSGSEKGVGSSYTFERTE